MYNAIPVRRVSIEGIGRHNIAGLEQAREGIVVHKHGATEAAANASQVLHIVLHVRAHRLRPAHITPSHAAILEREICPCMCAHSTDCKHSRHAHRKENPKFNTPRIFHLH